MHDKIVYACPLSNCLEAIGQCHHVLGCFAADDYHLTACVSLMKYFVAKYGQRYIDTAAQQNSGGHRLSVIGCNPSSLLSMPCKSTSIVFAEILHSSAPSSDSDSRSPSVSRRPSVDENDNVAENKNHSSNSQEMTTDDSKPLPEVSAEKYYATRSSKGKNKRLSVKTLELAITCCQRYISDLDHGDLDVHEQVFFPCLFCLSQLKHTSWVCVSANDWIKTQIIVRPLAENVHCWP